MFADMRRFPPTSRQAPLILRSTLIGLTLAAASASTLVACGDDEKVNGSSASSDTEVTAAPTTTTSTTTAPAPTTRWSVPATSPKRYMEDMKVLRVDGKDIVQFTFDNGAPG